MFGALDTVLKAQRKGEQLLLVLDGIDRIIDEDDMRPIARILRALELTSVVSPWRLLLTCQSALWDRVKGELTSLNVPLAGARQIAVDQLEKSEIEQIAKDVRDIAPVLLREDLRSVIGRPKVLDLVACAAAEVGLPDVTQWVGESSVIEWAWDKFVRGGNRGDQHARLLQHIAARQADSRLFAVTLAELTTPDTGLIADLARLGILVRRYDTVRFAHDLYADYARQRYLLALFSSRRFADLESRLPNPLWHRAVRLVGLHLLEYRDAEKTPDVDGWRELVHAFDERGGVAQSEEDSDDESARPGVGVDLLLEGVTFAAQPAVLLDSINADLVADGGVLLRSFLFRFKQAATSWVLLRDIMTPPPGDVSENTRSALNRLVALPEIVLWSPVIEWTASHAAQVISLAPDEFMDAAEFWLTSTEVFLRKDLFKSRHAQLLAHVVIDLAARAARENGYNSNHSRAAKNRARLFQMMLLCGIHERQRVQLLARSLSGLVNPAPPTRRPTHRLMPPSYGRPIETPPFWPMGPKAEPDEQFRRAALTTPGAQWLITIDAKFACDIFLALLIEVPDPDRSGDRVGFECGYHFDASFHFARPPFWDFAPAHYLLAKDPIVGIDFVVQLVDFAVDRWAERWPDVAHAGSIFDRAQPEVPTVTLTVGGVQRKYLGDARVLEWHQGGSQGPDVAAAALMALEHWLYSLDEEGKLGADVIDEVFSRARSVAVLGVLFELAFKNPAHLFGSLEPLVQCAELYLWARTYRFQVRPQTAMIPWWGEAEGRVKVAHDWHSMQHRAWDFLKLVAFLFAQQGLVWSAIEEARRGWAELANQTQDERLREWIRDMLLSYFDKDNWRSFSAPDGAVGLEYVHPETIEKKQAADREDMAGRSRLRYLPLQCRQIVDGKTVIDERRLVELLEAAATSFDGLSEDDAWLLGGTWTPRCGAAAVAIIKFNDWLGSNPKWQAQCREWLVEACRTSQLKLRPDPSFGDIFWDSFCADVLPRLWMSKPADMELRQCLARLVAAPHLDTRQRLFTALARGRAEHPEDFRRLLHLAVWHARLVVLDYGPPHEQPGAGSVESGAQKTFLRFAEDFVRGTLVPLPENWELISEARPKGLKVNPYGEHDGFRDDVLVKAFAWLDEEVSRYNEAGDRDMLQSLVEGLASVVPRRLSGSHDEEEPVFNLRSPVDSASLLVPVSLPQRGPTNDIQKPEIQTRLGRFASKIRRVMNDAMVAVRNVVRPLRKREPRRLPTVPSRPRRSLGTPYESDYRVAGIVAMFLIRERDADARRKLWEPWLRLEDRCHYWVDLLLDKIYLAAAVVGENDSVFSELMRDIFDHALADGGWLDGRSRKAHRISDVGRAFLGAGNGGEFWSIERAPAAVALRSYWPRWADAAMTWHGCAAAFIRFLRKPAMASMRPSCLEWLVRSDPVRWMSDEEAQMALVRLLDLVWEERREAGRELTGASRAIFERLLRDLVTNQVVEAVHLSGLVAQGS